MGLELRILTDESTNTGFTLDINQDEDFPLALNFGIAEIQDIGKTKSTFSKTFRVHETVENNKNLKSIYYTSTSDDSGVKATNVAFIIEDGTPICKGYVRIKNVIETARRREYEFVFFGSNFAWIKKFRELSLQDLDFSSDNHTFNVANIKASWDDGSGNPADADDRSYIYPIISYGTWKKDYPKFDELRPGVFHKSILDKGFEVLLDSTVEKYNINSTFLNGTYFKRLFMPFSVGEFKSDQNKGSSNYEDMKATLSSQSWSIVHNPEIRGTDTYDERGYISGFTVEEGLTQQNAFKDAFFNGIGAAGLDGVIINNGVYTITVRATITYTALNIPELTNHTPPRVVNVPSGYKTISIDAYKSDEFSDNNLVRLGGASFTPSKTNKSKTIEFTVDNVSKSNIDSGDYKRISFRWRTEYSGEQKFKYDLEISNVVVLATKKESVVVGHTINIANTLPDIKLSDYFKGLSHIFNLYVDTDEWSREIRIEPRDDFYKATSQSLDWTSKLDLSNGFNINYIDSYNKSIRFEYKEDNADKLVSRFNEAKENSLGAGEVDLSDRFPQGDTVFVNPLFSGTLHNRVQLTAGENLSDEEKNIIPCLWNKIGVDGQPSTPTYNFNPRILYYDYVVQTDSDGNTIRWLFDQTAGTSIYDIDISPEQKLPTGYFTDTVEGTSLDQEHLHFEGNNGLIDKYYQGTLGLMNEGVNVSVRFNLTKEDIQTLDLSKPIYLSAPSQIAGYYVINSINDYKPSVIGSTGVTLTKIVNTSPIITKDKFKGDVVKLGGGRRQIPEDLTIADRNAWEASSTNSSTSDKYVVNYNDRVSKSTEFFKDDTGAEFEANIELGTDRHKDSFVLNNGSKNEATPFSGNIAMGTGVVAVGNGQTALGTYNTPSTTDKLSIGAGTSDEERLTAISVTNTRRVQIYGGETYMEDSNGNLVNVITEVDGQYDKVYLSKE